MSQEAPTTQVNRTALIDRFLALRPTLNMRLTMKSLPPELKQEMEFITVHQIAALQYILPAGLMMRDLARALDITDGSAAVLSDRLVKRGLAVRRSDPTDRRVVWLMPSEKARCLIERFIDCEREKVKSAFSVLPDTDLATFIAILERMAAAHELREHPSFEQVANSGCVV